MAGVGEAAGKADDGPPKQPMKLQNGENLDNLLLVAAEKMLPQDKESKEKARLGHTASRVPVPIAVTLPSQHPAPCPHATYDVP